MNNAQVVAAGGQAAHPHQNGGNAGNYTSISGSKNYFRRTIFLVKTQGLFQSQGAQSYSNSGNAGKI